LSAGIAFYWGFPSTMCTNPSANTPTSLPASDQPLCAPPATQSCSDGAFRFWQDKKIAHMSNFTATLLALSSAGIAFVFSTLEKQHGYIGSPAAMGAMGSIVLFGVAIVFAMLGMSSRLLDLRATAQVARLRESGNIDICLICRTRETAEVAGNRTWIYFHVQLFTFGFAIAFLAVLATNLYGSRVFEQWMPPAIR
jgi:hypothetical protein